MVDRIFHIADIQIELSLKDNRLNEYTYVFNEFYTKLKNEIPDRLVIAGDIFENWDSNDDEIKLFIDFLLNCVKYTKKIIIIGGNHDYKQQANFIVESSKKIPLSSKLEVITKAINNPNIIYFEQTGFYKDENIVWCVWGHKQKFHSYLKEKYNPFDLKHELNFLHNKREEGLTYIELYHDPINECVDFLDREINSNLGLSIDSFNGDIILAGDIHKPMIKQNSKGAIFSYSSSMVIRNFKEGDYWINGKILQNGSIYHGFNIVDVKNKKITFEQLKNNTSYHTIILDEDFDYDTDFAKLFIYENQFNKIKVKPKHHVTKFNPSKIQEFFITRYNTVPLIIKDDLLLDTEINTNTSSDSFISEIKTPEKQREILIEYLKQENFSEEDTNYILFIDDKVNEKMPAEDIVYNRLSINKIVINNFRTFGDNVRFDLSHKGIYKINALNETGKTTLLEALKLVFTGATSTTSKIDSHTKTSKYSLNSYLNDSREKDTASIELYFNLNSEEYSITYLVNREWKRDFPHYFTDKTEQVREHIRNIKKTLTIKKKINGKYVVCTSEPTDFITKIVPSYEDYMNTVELNSDKLNYLLELDDFELVEYMLKNLGIGFSEIKSEIFKKEVRGELAKTTDLKKGEDVTLLENISTNSKTIIENELLVLDSKSKISEIETKISEIETTIEDTNRKIHNIDIELISKANQVNQELNSLNSNKNTIKNVIVQKEQKLLENNDIISDELYDDYKNIIEKFENQKDKLTNEISKLANEIDKINSDIYNNNGSINELTDKFVKINENKIIKLKEKSLSLVNRIEELRANYNKSKYEISSDLINKLNSKQTERLELQKQIGDITNAMNLLKDKGININESFKTKIADKESEIVKAQNSTSCSTCNREYDKNHYIHILQNIEELTSEVKSLTQDKESKLSSIKIEYNEKLNNKNAIQGIITEIDREIENIKNEEKNILNNTILLLLTKEISELEEQKVKIGNDITYILEEILCVNRGDYSVNSDLQNRYNTIVKLNDDLYDKINSIKKQIGVLQENIISLLEKDNIEYKKSCISKYDDNITIVQHRDILLNEIKTLNNEILEIDNKISILKDTLLTIDSEKNKQKENLVIESQLNELRNNKKTIIKNIEELNNTINSSNNKIIKLKTINELNTERVNKYNEVVKQRKLFDVYAGLMDKNGLPKLIFSKIVSLINSELDELLSGLDFKLFFDKTNNKLKMIDFSHNQRTERDGSEGSGMQRTFCVLALKNILKKYNNRFNIDFLVLDEITGKLDERNKVKMVDVIRKLEKYTGKIFLIDQDILDINKLKPDFTLNLIKTNEGTILDYDTDK